MSDIAILIPAAGLSSRMKGADKLLERVEGAPLLRLVAQRALQTGADVIISLPAPDHPRQAVLPQHARLSCVFVEDPALGMGHSVATLASALKPHHAAALILPSDMPEIDVHDIETVMAARDPGQAQAIYRGAARDGTAGHPVLLPRCYFSALRALSGDVGARGILKQNPDRVVTIPLPDRHALTDLDTPEDWACWRARQGSGS